MKSERPRKSKYGHYQNVCLTDQELADLKADFPHDWDSRIENLSSSMKLSGKKYKDHAAIIRKWAAGDQLSSRPRGSHASKDSSPPPRPTSPGGEKERLLKMKDQFFKKDDPP